MSTPVSREEVADLLGDVDVTLAERIAGTGASVDELGAAIDDLEHERHLGERRMPASAKIAEVREILSDDDGDDVPGGVVIPIHGILIAR